MSGTATGRILVVDDVPENIRLLEAMLLPRGYDVVSAAEGRAALGSQDRRSRISSCWT